MLHQSVDVGKSITAVGYALLTSAELEAKLDLEVARLDELRGTWSQLPRDRYLRDGGKYRHRRHGCFTYDSATQAVTLVPHRAHWQPTDYNALHGGMERWFEPIDPAVTSAAIWQQLLRELGALFAGIRPVARWYIEAHQFRIDTAAGLYGDRKSVV